MNRDLSAEIQDLDQHPGAPRWLLGNQVPVIRAAIHRELTTGSGERYNSPFFFNPVADCRLASLPTLVDANHPRRYRPIVGFDCRGPASR